MTALVKIAGRRNDVYVNGKNLSAKLRELKAKQHHPGYATPQRQMRLRNEISEVQSKIDIALATQRPAPNNLTELDPESPPLD